MSAQQRRLLIASVLAAVVLLGTAGAMLAWQLRAEQPAGACAPTRADAEGPYYVPGAPVRSSVGQGHVLSGVVRSSEDCAPLAGARVELWQAGPDGEYGDDYRATLFAGDDGSYRFEGPFPPPYAGRPSHIHLRVEAAGFRTLITQYYPPRAAEQGTFDLVLRPGD